MFPKGKAATVPSDTQAKEKLANYVYEYLIHIGASKAAQMFLQEIHWENKPWNLGESPGFLSQWWCVFYDLYSAAPERRETFEHSSEAKAFHDYGFVNSGFPNGLPRNASISPMSGGLPPGGGRPPSSQGIMPPDSGIHTPSIQGGPMMVPGGHFFPPGHPIGNPAALDLMRNRGVLPPSMRFPPPGGPHQGMMPGYAGGPPPRHRFMSAQQGPPGQPPAHSPAAPGGVPQPGGGGDVGMSVAQMDGSPSHASHTSQPNNQPAPAFPPPPVSETSTGTSQNNNTPTPTTSAQSDSQNNNTPLLNGNAGGGTPVSSSNNNTGGPSANTPNNNSQGHVPPPQFPPHTHTMEYLPPPPFDNGHPNSNNSSQNNNPGMKQPHHSSPAPENPSGLIQGPPDFCNPLQHSFPGGPPHPDHPQMHGGSQSNSGQQPPHSRMTPISQIQMMQQSQQQVGPPIGAAGGPPPFMSNPQQPPQGAPGGIPISAGSNQFPDYAFTSMSQAI